MSETRKKTNNPLLFWKTLKLIIFFPEDKFLYKFLLEFMSCKLLIKTLIHLGFLSTATECTHPTDKMVVLASGTAAILVKNKQSLGSLQSFNHCRRVIQYFKRFSLCSHCLFSVHVCGTYASGCSQRDTEMHG